MIFKDDDYVKIDGVTLPVIITSFVVKHEALIEEQEVEGSSIRPKQAVGYEDAKITIKFKIGDSESMKASDKLRILQNLFKKDGQKKPTVHELVADHATWRGVKKVLVKEFDTSEESGKESFFTGTIVLWEYIPVTITASTSASSNTSNSFVSTGNSSYDSYVQNSRGKAPSYENKTDSISQVNEYGGKKDLFAMLDDIREKV